MSVPNGYCGIVAIENEASLHCEESFSHYISWNLQDPPTEDAQSLKAMQWVELAECVSL